MAEYTIELGKLMALNFHPALDSYPLFNENYRETLNTKILRHYWFHEIGAETADRFNFYLETKMWEIMPYYNQMYESELLELDPLTTENMTDTEKRIFTGSRINNTTGTDSHTLDKTTTDTVEGKKTNTGTVKNDGSTSEDSTRTDNLQQTINTDQTTTNNLTTTTTNESDGTGTNTTEGTKSSIFSDIPQAPQSATENYATTRTNDTTNESSNTTTHEEGNGSTQNTGTVTIDGEQTTSNTETVTTDTKGTSSNTQTNDLTENTSETSNGTSKDDFDRNYSENQNRNDSENETIEHTRVGYNNIPAVELLKKWRETFLNIDMMIIEELRPLFMEIY